MRDEEKYRKAHNEACKRWRARAAKRYEAQQIVKHAIKAGRLVPWPGCAACKRKRNLEAHHPNYDAPLSVVWLCMKCHKKTHAIVGFRNTGGHDEVSC